MSMKKLLIAAVGIVALASPALAADMAPAPAYKAPPPVLAPSWTGFWISGGFGYGLDQYQHSEYASTTSAFPPGTLLGVGQDIGGKGWLGKVGVGYDYQFMDNFVIGAFADTDWSNISGQGTNYVLGAPVVGSVQSGQYRNDYSWAVGARVGYVALPGLLTYFNAGYTQAHFKQVNYTDDTIGDPFFGTPNGVTLAGQNRGGYFIGGGTEYAVKQLPGLFWKNEVRFSEFDDKTNPQVCTSLVVVTCLPNAVIANQTSHVYEQKVTTELVYRFNWGGPVVAKY
jgi:outer membrane immunogenic protein